MAVDFQLKFDARSKNLMKDLQKAGLLGKVANEFKQRVAMDIATKARAIVKKWDYTKAGRKSIRAKKGNITALPHMAIQNFGRAPGGKMPPHEPIAAWAEYRGIPAKAVYPIRMQIKNKGTKPKKFMSQAVERALKDEKKLDDYMERAIARQVRALERKR